MSFIFWSKCVIRSHYLVHSLKYISFGNRFAINWTHIKTSLKAVPTTNRCLTQIRHKCGVNEALNRRPKTLWSWNIISGLLVWLGIIEEPEDPLILTIKRGVYCMQCEEYSKAELILHSALHMSQELAFESAETYVLDVLANNYFKKGDYVRAEQVFKDVFNRVLAKGMAPNEEPIVEMSIKLSHIYSITGDVDKSDIGFDFCLTEQTKRVDGFRHKCCDDMTDEEINSMALMGMCYDYYSKHLSSIGHFDKAIDSLTKAIDICLNINGRTHSQTLVLYNDLSAIYVHKKDYENALVYMKKAIDGAVTTEDKHLAKYYTNLGFVYLQRFEKDLALKWCTESLALILRAKDNDKETNRDKTKDRKLLEEKARKCVADSTALRNQ
ncbi:unnamed protein product [Medioppia subpectinata]|uniref:Tetratricopeptide repeat protein 19, mitochondrial n=1 Tax=Medioppia subpectinata TaxID=1979941 RepID=A0A7R9PZQ7_9ACAR|nr:unnamed protein product [Medioppia subpectinata]CAG2106427.1 unnamed protein product [Medioppia subpectinata]